MMAQAAERREDIDVARLSAVLEVLANENRLELLRQLRVPRTAREVTLQPPDVRPGENPERPISRQAARVHLNKLAEIGVVVARRTRRGHTVADEYVLNQQRIFAIAEEFRRLASLRASLPPGSEATLDGRPPGSPKGQAGVRLVLVHGLDEGRTFPLALHEHGEERGWVIGRREGAAVCLDYDPYVSSENSEVTCIRGRYVLQDLRSSRNGTYVNWQQMPKGGSRELLPGDVIGVGRSLLLFLRD
jgi:DNA-binding transcriptional ArsR family regulator